MSIRVEPGSEIGGYRVVRVIGEGGMGTVYLAEQPGSGRRVGLKVLHSTRANDDEFRTRFLRESRYASALHHPNIVPVHEVGEDDGVPYLVMDYVEGCDLSTELAERGPLELERSGLIVEQVASALDALHSIGVHHRDVKPANVIIGSDGGVERCYLTDFGLSRNPSEDSRALTAAGLVVGTSHYVAPEQVLAADVDHRADVYSLGCVLYECLAGTPPFPRGRNDQVLHSHVQDPPPRVTERRPELPTSIDEVVARAMAKDPAERYATCGALASALRAAIDARKLSPVAGASPDEPPAEPRECVRFKITQGNARGDEIRVEDELVIGRTADSEGRLADDPEISRRHARISRAAGGFTIEDLGSTNGTFMNGRRIDEPELLSVGDRIEVGGTTLVVQVSVSPPATAVGEPEMAAAASEPGPPDDEPAEREPEPEPPDEEPAEPEPAPPDEEPAEPGPAPVAQAEPPSAEPEPVLPPLSLRVDFDAASGEVRVEVGPVAEPLRLVFEGGRWRLAPGAGDQ